MCDGAHGVSRRCGVSSAAPLARDDVADEEGEGDMLTRFSIA
jgi:hypothetical protein